MSFALALLALSQASSTGSNSITFEMLTPLGEVGWTIQADGSGEFFDLASSQAGSRPAVHDRFSGPAENFGFARKTLAEYRKRATESQACKPDASSGPAFRLTWLESGKTVTAIFGAGCGATPDDFMDVLRPIGQRLDRLLAEPPGNLGDDPSP